uniref:Uncharacterized protein n=1 Tax=Anguilla anguilla TaxID=7936 RepID=A0A0E9R7V4_ANGAN
MAVLSFPPLMAASVNRTSFLKSCSPMCVPLYRLSHSACIVGAGLGLGVQYVAMAPRLSSMCLIPALNKSICQVFIL